MNADRYQLIAFIATLVALAFVFDSALVAAALNNGVMGKLEVFGLGTVTGGLIGVLKAPTRSTGASEATVTAALNKLPDAAPPDTPQPVTVINPPENPVPVAPAQPEGNLQ